MKIGIIGCGNMCECILNGLVLSKEYPPEEICIFNRTAANLKRLCEQYGVQAGKDAVDVVRRSNVVMLGVKPYAVCSVVEKIRDAVTEDKIILSVAAAIKISSIERALGHARKVVRVMPNVPTRVGAGLTSVTPNALMTREDTALILKMFSTLGKAVEVAESQIHAVIAVAGSAPAYVFMFMEAMGDAAVHGGLPRDQAYEFAAQAVMGAAKMLQDSDMSPAQLKDMVCSPGGTTIEAVRSLEKGGLRSTVIEAMVACADRSKVLEANLN
ncbi:pyrroline-5-carboxylate reductase, putative [Trypanosoma cruzi]|uniref:Pyrroline-5-carboxylate reductase n=1 Tax=Trypanosoma cruzi Dm28c TaxID=1416333 RepID=V5BVR2_TRYCR|nr:pyrroline-5-carboxylate reductase, putative [Trypanosoma cruzi]ESS68613.1 pyrroline-5-carboxylate reductase [Trypanosoma cruzi Dm28c]